MAFAEGIATTFADGRFDDNFARCEGAGDVVEFAGGVFEADAQFGGQFFEREGALFEEGEDTLAGCLC